MQTNPFVKGETLVFLDEVQECKELVTAIKFLVDEGSFRYVLSGSLPGVELNDIRSMPVGYLNVLDMYPLDFEEFCMANGVSSQVLDMLRDAFARREPVDPMIHDKMMDTFRLYLIVGGMPAAVATYLQTNDLRIVAENQRSIVALYKKDIAKYDRNNKLYLNRIFDLIPSELNSKNKRFILKTLNRHFKYSRYENSFLWLKDAGVALPVYTANDPTVPLVMSCSSNLFKLFLADVGLLASMYADGIQLKILNRDIGINFGSVYENAAAQELHAHGFPLFYYNSKIYDEVDFLMEWEGRVLPVEIKSGKDYARHAALNALLKTQAYGIREAFVFCNDNVKISGGVIYYPIYMLMFLEKKCPARI